MGASVANLEELTSVRTVELLKHHTPQVSELLEQARNLQRLARQVETGWGQIPAEAKIILKDFGYSLNQSYLRPNPWQMPRVISFLIKAVIKGEIPALLKFGNALLEAQEAILCQVERENSSYQAAVADAIDDVVGGRDPGREMSLEEFRELVKTGKALHH
ncbi:hypothetical protein Mterra_00250 [Calidithermus terrae]|uniref:Uncharacterized protein n=2 Tax=Calidithermus terrae TaxID=1408545 RepID=A0A399F378_9DEIN|nr:hypothetical protein Mterra_00250 [Calidithermus terrae]